MTLVRIAVLAGLGLQAQSPETPALLHRRTVQDGLAVDLYVEPAAKPKAGDPPLRHGDTVKVRFEMTDTATHSPVRRARPAAWLDLRAPGEERTESGCTAKLKGLFEGGARVGPSQDLNVYYAVTMNNDASLSVVDPLFGFGGSRLLALVPLKAAGYDWALTTDQRRLFVSMPAANAVASVDTLSWTVASNLDVAMKPGRVALQPDQHYLWVASESSGFESDDSGVTVFDAASLQPAARIVTGAGVHQMAFSGDSHYAFVANAASISVIDVGTLRQVAELPTAPGVASLAWSEGAQMLYVTHAGGLIAAIDSATLTVAARLDASPGIGRLSFAPGGRFGFIVNGARREVAILDTATNRIPQVVDTGRDPDQVTFSDTLAYIRHKSSDTVLMVTLGQIGTQGTAVQVADFTGGNHPPGEVSEETPAEGIVPVPGGDAVLVANARDKSVYYYKQGMAAPMGSFTNYDREPRAVLVVDRSLYEQTPGIYETSAILGEAGMYDLVFYTSTPTFAHCFEVPVSPNPDLPRSKSEQTVEVQFVNGPRVFKSGETVRVAFQFYDREAHAPKTGVKDVAVLSYLAPGLWRSRLAATETSEAGVYSVSFVPPRPGVYYLHVGSNSLRLGVSEGHYLAVRVQ